MTSVLKSFCIALIFLIISGENFALGIKYSLNFNDAQTHYINVSMRITDINESQLLLKIPVWTPGSYMLREFSKNIESVQAFAGKTNIEIIKTRKNTWQINTTNKKEILVTYSYYANELTVRTCHTDAEHAFINPSNICMYIDGHVDVPSTIEINPYSNWNKISTPLAQVGDNQWTRTATNYDELADSPIEMGNHQTIMFNYDDAEHEIAIFGDVKCDEKKVVNDFKKIIKECVNVFGELPYKRYVFFSQHFAGGGGGLEHKNSCSLQSGINTFDSLSSYKGYLGLVAHEYFHCWNVKRLRPAPLGPFDYDNENYTQLLWIAEGFTAYYDDLLTYRAGFLTEEEYTKAFAGSVSYVLHVPGNNVQSLAESSFDAWIKYYRPNENSQNATISYYTKGSVVAWMLDLEIIKNTKGKKCLDDLMRLMYNKYFKELDRAFTFEDFLQEVNTLVGKDMSPFFEKYVFAASATPDIEELKQGGINLIVTLDSSLSFGSGIKTSGTQGYTKVTSVNRNSAAWQAGINSDDFITQINKVTVKNNFDSLYNAQPIGSEINFTLIRRNHLTSVFATKKMLPVYQVKILPYRENKLYYYKWLHRN